jgi:3-hydroxyisobutyrate dehydrogenase
MGKSMATHLLNKGHKIFVYNRTLSKTDDLVKIGAIVLEPLEMAKQC